MEIKDRLKIIRGDLNQKDFGARIFMSQDSISMMERGVMNVSDRTIDLICKEFSINRQWLETGEGEMKKPPLDEVADVLSDVLNVGDEDPVYKRTLSFLKIYQQLDDKSKAVIQRLLDELLKDS